MFPNTFGKIFCGLMRQNLNYLNGLSPVKSGVTLIAFHKKNIFPTVSHGGSRRNH